MTKREYAEAIAKEIEGTEVRENNKANGIIRIGISKKVENGIAPCVYIDEAYECGKEIEEVVEMVKEMMNVDVPSFDVDVLNDFENVKGKIRARLYSNTTKAEVYESAEKYGFHDLILIPYIENVIETDEGKGSIKISNNLLEHWNVDAETIMKIAMENVKYNISQFLGMMTIVSNATVMDIPQYGASSVIKAREELMERFPNGYVVIPSSIHEVIIQPYPETEDDYNYMIDMVKTVNETQVAPEEVLSYSVYKFPAA